MNDMMKSLLACDFKKPYKSASSSVSVATKIANTMICKWGGGIYLHFCSNAFCSSAWARRHSTRSG